MQPPGPSAAVAWSERSGPGPKAGCGTNAMAPAAGSRGSETAASGVGTARNATQLPWAAQFRASRPRPEWLPQARPLGAYRAGRPRAWRAVARAAHAAAGPGVAELPV